MMTNAPFAAAGIAELSPEEARELGRTLLIASAIPFMVYSVCAVATLAFLFRKPSRRQLLRGRTLIALITLVATLGFLLLIPSLCLLLPFSVWW